jgi:hypothetical protein
VCWLQYQRHAIVAAGQRRRGSGLRSGSLLVDLEFVHAQPLYLKLLDLEPPDDRAPDRQTPDRQGAGGGTNRGCPDRERAFSLAFGITDSDVACRCSPMPARRVMGPSSPRLSGGPQ